mmetsp:Transcript_19937/g.35580  ORF Transcript_19937/g.35580 Transcript_19937/m.35580 type:complete len:570 (+) Transcript_19937:828-2537(+)
MRVALVKHALSYVLLGVVPSSTSVGHHHSEEESRRDGPSEQTHEHQWTNHDTDDDRHENRKGSGQNHFLDGLCGTDVDALLAVQRLAFKVFLVELEPTLVHDRLGGLANGKHGESGEDERKGCSEDDSGQDDFVQEVNIVQVDGIGKGVHQSESGEDSGTDGETLSCGSSGVSKRIEGVCGFPGAVRDFFGHFGDSSGVIGNRTESIGGEGDAKCRKHSHRRNSNTVDIGEGVGDEDRDDDAQNWGNGGKHTNTKTLDDNSGGACVGLLSNGHSRRLSVGSAEFCGESDGVTADESGENGQKESPGLAVARTEGKAESDPGESKNQKTGKENGSSDAPQKPVEHVGGFFHFFFLIGGFLDRVACAYKHSADDGGNGAESGEPEREGDTGVSEALDSDSASSNDRTRIRLEKIGTHTSNISDVISNVVRDCGRVLRRVLGKIFLNFSNKVGSHIGGFRVDSSTHTGKQSDARTSKGEGRNVFPNFFPVLPGLVDIFEANVEDSDTDKSARDDRESHNGSALECNLQTTVQVSGFSGICRFAGDGSEDVGSGGYSHTDVSRGGGKKGAKPE